MDKKRVLISGANSYIGESFEKWVLGRYPEAFEIDTLDMLSPDWRNKDFSSYDSVFHVAGIAHADVGKISKEREELYYKVNRDLAIEVAKKAKAAGVKQFVFMSSAIIYGSFRGQIDSQTKTQPLNAYGDSKWQADKGLRELNEEGFNVAVLRPPMVYGKGSKGNYALLAKIAKKTKIFPDYNNKRSMLYIDNLSEFLANIMLSGKGGIFFPQNKEYVKTSQMVRLIAEEHGKKIILTKAFNLIIKMLMKIPGKIGNMSSKAFGDLSYEQTMSQYDFEYQLFNLKSSIKKTEE